MLNESLVFGRNTLRPYKKRTWRRDTMYSVRR